MFMAVVLDDVAPYLVPGLVAISLFDDTPGACQYKVYSPNYLDEFDKDPDHAETHATKLLNELMLMQFFKNELFKGNINQTYHPDTLLDRIHEYGGINVRPDNQAWKAFIRF
jgi:hypothetical protein